MKTPVAITLIIVGGMLVAAPIVSDYLERAQIAAVMGKPGVSSVNLQPTLSSEYRLGCWILGSAMVAAAILFSRRSGGNSERP
jgi:hypothetical protein